MVGDRAFAYKSNICEKLVPAKALSASNLANSEAEARCCVETRAIAINKQLSGIK
jgi:hypothetical protein